MDRSTQVPFPVAVIGMSCKFGGDATDEDAFWNFLLDGRSAAEEVPKHRYHAHNFYHRDYNRLDTLPNTVGYFLKDDVGAFDAPFFSITPAEAAAMDPQSRVLLETSYRAFENAGMSMDRCSGTSTSVYVGCSAHDYQMLYSKDTERPIRHSATGMAPNMLSNKISWFYNLKGPSLTIDTACSSALNAVHLGCQDLWTGQTQMSVVGGVNLCYTPDSQSPLSHLNFFSPDGKCYSFDHRANGYSRGEGYGIFVLKSLPDALRDRDNIRAVIRSTGSNENGRTAGGITKVNGTAQEELIRATYARAGLDLTQTRYVEAHGPGTAGDLIESAALYAVFGSFRTPQDPLYIGSVKANIGHLEGAAGVSSLAKTILSLERGVMPKLANFEKLHPDIAAKAYPFTFPTDNTPWPPGLRRASVNSFGFGGSNAHIVVEDAQQYSLLTNDLGSPWQTIASPDSFMASFLSAKETEATKATANTLSSSLDLLTIKESAQSLSSAKPRLLVLSAADRSALTRVIEGYQAYAQNKADKVLASADQSLDDLSYTLSEHRNHFLWRASAVVSSWQDLTSLSQRVSTGVRALVDPKLAFVFTGQGAQWARMGLTLTRYPVFAQTILECQRTLQVLGCSWNIVEELGRSQEMSRVYTAEFSQPLCTIVQLALVQLLRSCNVSPVAVIGHSSGEIAAAYCAGGLTLQDACKVAYFRGVFSNRIEKQEGQSSGMMAVGLDASSARTSIEQLSSIYPSVKVCVACVNSPSSVTLSGDREQLKHLEEVFKAESIFARLLQVKVAYHSPYISAIAADYKSAIGNLEGATETHSARFFSTLQGKEVDISVLQDPNYWIGNLTSPVLFSDGIQALVQSAEELGLKALVEIGPHPALQMPAEQAIKAISTTITLPYHAPLSRFKDDCASFLQLLGSLHCLAYPALLDINGKFNESKLLQDLPGYPFDHSRIHWHESRLSKNYRFRKFPRSDFLGIRSPDWNYLQATWRNIIRTLENPWVEDHKIDGTILYPGAGMVVMAIEAAAQHSKDLGSEPITGFKLKNVAFLKSLNISLLPEGTETQITLRPLKDPGDRKATWSLFNIFIFENQEWNEVCRGKIMLEHEENSNPLKGEQFRANANADYEDQYGIARNLCKRKVNTEFMYRRLQDSGLYLGPTFRNFTKISGSQHKRIVATINPRQWTCKMAFDQASPHFIHPATLDGMVQLGVCALSRCGDDDMPTMVPSRIRNMWISAAGLDGSDESSLEGFAQSDYTGYRGASMNVTALSPASHKPLVVIEGLETTIIDAGMPTNIARKLCYDLQWKPIENTLSSDSGVCDESSSNSSQSNEHLTIVTSGAASQAEFAAKVQSHLRELSDVCCQITTLADMKSRSVDRDEKLIFVLDVNQSFFRSLEQNKFDDLKQLLLQVQNALWILPVTQGTEERISGEFIGLSRSLRTEYPELKLVTALIEPTADLVTTITKVANQFLVHENSEHSYEPELLVKEDGTICVSRLEERSEMNSLLADERPQDMLVQQRFGDFDNLKLGIGNPGSLDTLQFVENTRLNVDDLGDTEIEVRPVYSGLNFMDLLTALGRIPQNVLGVECSGVVLRAGSATDLKTGDRVMLCGDGTFSSRTRCHYHNAVRIPDEMPFEVAGGLPGAAGTAYHALFNVARLQPDESVLIHAGAGATGQMAIQMAKVIGAEIFTTVGSQEKLDHVKQKFGIPEDHILFSRNTSFADDIRRITKGKGVDVVLNSLAGDSLNASWECIAPFGRFVEIGKRDIFAHKDLPMFPFAKNVSFHTIDLCGIWTQRSALMRRISEGVLGLWKEGKLKPASSLHIFPATDVEAAFRLLQSGKCIGKIILKMEPDAIVPIRLSSQPNYSFKSDATYAVVGAFGGLGKSVSRWLVEKGAKHLLLLSRSGAKTTEAQELVKELSEQGVEVVAAACDISDSSALTICTDYFKKTMPPIDGCIQASMVLRDSLFKDMTYDKWTESLASKSHGSWNLHCVLPKNMSFFIFLSSMSGIVGGRAQSNYAAGNAFQDALASHRVSRGMKAMSLNLGLMQDVGIVAENHRLMESMISEGFYLPMTQSNVRTLLNHYCNPSFVLSADAVPQLVCGVNTAAQVRKKGVPVPTWMSQPLFNAFWSDEEEVGDGSDDTSANLTGYRSIFANSSTAAEAASVVSNALVQRLSRSLGVSEGDIERSRALHFYGVDSLVAVELRNWFSREIQADVAVFEILGNRGCDSLALFATMRSNFRKAEWVSDAAA